MTRPDWPLFEPQRLGETFASWRENLAFPLQKLMVDARQMLGGGLLRKDNSLCAVVDLNFNNQLQLTSGVERLLANPLVAKGATPIGFTPWYAEDANGNPLKIAGCKFNPAPKDAAGNRLTGFVGVTVDFDLQHTLPLLEMHKTASQSIANNTATTVTWDAITNSRGSVITQSAGTFTVSEAGTYLVSWTFGMAGGTFTICQGTIISSTLTKGNAADTATQASDYISTISYPLVLAAGATFIANAFQTNGAAAARILNGTSENRNRIAVQRLYNNSVQQGRVLGVLEVG